MAKKYFVKRYGTRAFTAQELVELSHDLNLKDYDAVKSDTDLSWRTYGEFDFGKLAAEELGYKVGEDGTIIKNGGSSGGMSNPPKSDPNKNSSNSNNWIIGIIVVLLMVVVVGISIYHSNTPRGKDSSSSISTPTSEPEPEPKPPLPKGLYAFIGRCNVRTGPSETYEITYVANNGEPCFYDGVHDGDWYYIEVVFASIPNPVEGWTHRDNLRHLDKLPDP